jgi:DNA-binding GntR family transcriptional regulator
MWRQGSSSGDLHLSGLIGLAKQSLKESAVSLEALRKPDLSAAQRALAAHWRDRLRRLLEHSAAGAED